ncbi:MAG: hypothetical protein AB1498_08295 [bacterium]
MNIFYFICEAVLEIVKRPLSFILSLLVFIIPIYFLAVSVFLYREGGAILKQEKEKWGNFLVELDKNADTRFLEEQIKSLKEVKGLKNTMDIEPGKIIFQVSLNINLDETLKIEEAKRMISGLEGVKFVKYEGERIEYMEEKKLILTVSSLFLGIISSIFVVKYIYYRFKKESQLNSVRIKILEVAGAAPFYTYGIFIAKGYFAGLISGLLTVLFLNISLKNIFLNNQLQFFIYPSTVFIIITGSLFLISINYYLAVKKAIDI